jgi:hypothetical protein
MQKCRSFSHPLPPADNESRSVTRDDTAPKRRDFRRAGLPPNAGWMRSDVGDT